MSTKEVVSSGRHAARPPDQQTRSRELFVIAVDPETSFPGDPFVARLRSEIGDTADRESLPAALDGLRDEAVRWSTAESRRFEELGSTATAPPATESLVRRTALAAAPLALRSGAWLQWQSAPGNADDATTLRILTLYASDVGVGRPQDSRGSVYLALLRHLHLSEHAVPVARLVHDPRVADHHFCLPATLLAMSRRPVEFRPEIIGADLCLRTVGLLPALRLVRQAHPQLVEWSAIDPSAARDGETRTGLELCLDVVEHGFDDAELARVTDGFRWAFTVLRRWSTGLLAELEEALDPAYEMAELLRHRAREGAVYHRDFTVADRPLSSWLEEARTDPRGLLAELAASRLVKPGRSAQSPLVNGLVGERGPMFRVFSPADLVVIRRWIDSLPTGQPERARPGPVHEGQTVSPELLASVTVVAVGPVAGDREPADIREAYHLLQQRTDTPAVRRFAVDYVRGWLARSRHNMATDPQRLPDVWGREGLRPWLVEQHDRQGRDFEESAGAPMPTREDLVDSTVQLAPLTLIDGAWLQGFTDYEHAASEQGYFLFETYWDELGNGVPRMNHPLIYREVLAEMDVQVPPTASREFAEWDGFRDESFELPVYWLSIGRFPRTFMPEILGLNLAMELSGVGGTYRRARQALKRYGFSTKFVDIHNTIDNVATGHSAWAADAVDTYLASLPVSHGAQAVTEVWDRVRTGFRSLNPPTGLLARRAFRRARKASRSLAAI
ncbi:iron-containing redox enzyme family protein [Micromonospora sp. NPDC002389]|uniref:iron-containing redox enzyme family protein n=1 Tax=Micromonospora sp. NPDC002389 TaxID=3154272 RepID=UPI0033176EDB